MAATTVVVTTVGRIPWASSRSVAVARSALSSASLTSDGGPAASRIRARGALSSERASMLALAVAPSSLALVPTAPVACA
jgi:hypothetical protein